MAAASMLISSSNYLAAYGSPVSAVVSSAEPYRAAYNNPKSLLRQTLPSISEVISGTRLGSKRPLLTGRPELSCCTSPVRVRKRILPSKFKEPAAYGPVSGGHRQPPAPTPQPDQASYMLAGHMPLPGHPTTSYHEQPNTFQSQTHSNFTLDNPRFRDVATSPRSYVSWTYQEFFSRIRYSPSTTVHFAKAYGRVDQQQHLPCESEVNEMLANLDLIKRDIEQVCIFIQSTKRPVDGNHDVNMHNNGWESAPRNVVKKRRVRVGPSRCHSCNITQAPEWRRGPEGAGTLCNACGLHYAKLERNRLRAENSN
ncbi:GATA zinc finger domain-containing protein 10 [Beauveria bassiana]|uniref:GATA zinc finger protein n=1 Tax=Beauveria bassiana (strain ARSEF 2860) TaxID=655819 RepID=J5JC48_BEAB2|nr:GATA zinc finger protein [Beauveria bassiana ARSEF 2860]EJP61481.1 GATA zinc finger protein [Beauveria bassiana ARSEF 2860]KAF1731358.1 GATA zinc finger domain-containing protein 10 [Beauveria bassiana]KAH8715576.1 GATA zinc finger domain-containing protein 10 [Beauveria bassiana]